MNYDEARSYITNTAKFGSKLGLDRTEKLLELLGNPHKKLKCIHIAGTNGKGSTSAMVSSILVEAGYKVGSYISPFIEEFEERIQINNKNISKDDLSDIITEVSKAVEKIVELGYINPTEFEIITCAGFLYFYKNNIDFAVIEVGLGGRLDSTNVITPILSIITSISLDHTLILGDTLEKIAYEKAGIIKMGIPVVVYPQKKQSYDVIEKKCREKKCQLIKVPRDSAVYLGKENLKQVVSTLMEGQVTYKNNVITQKIEIKTLNNDYIIDLALLGKHQLLNCSVAVHAIEAIIGQGVIISKDNIIAGLINVVWPARLEVMNRRPLVVIDGAHNIDGIKNLTESIDMYFNYNKIILILGILADKQVEEMIKTIVPKAYRVITVTPHSERAELSEELKVQVEKYTSKCESIEDYELAYKKALSYCEDDDLLLVSGSLYMVGDMRKIIRNVHVQ
ncbi:bifunctional folylpolyglutamate synthase/dihydrofolate synthase [Clostridium estertheticum]|uniref:bifunctional folylpolyglutamate synthase/dihydrofolate synthase n=1 Tax=Clostridium estertheticum TaxID=238834 RepID=UPI001CF0F819|nr:folylpolyglutamate synthase/dihydrofolate synthase family protein [Clostridium estertheticum]MCB2307517.1 bifunctional folylpolyglutamate synthase/dihydrofolate synthase [Clostridium estertheticum]MCB2345774.1 bifunctional folylpolyglutamate synthase/dihydrofolate synthase [Clostridium estertheticum]MCB2351006.1 bifunctional folylpolyglutamate synthase/dihydrofolate synthase [Clostridium estertheticum]WAG47823.1 bifunctional folylpolyglutamate synthase/dihydrofolate synthase [Clostridium est